MQNIWLLVIVSSLVLSLTQGSSDALLQAILACGKDALQLTFTLCGALMLWTGLLRILERTGDVQRLGVWLRRILQPLFPGLTHDEAWQAISLNLSANILGLGNAATPAGIRAASLLEKQGANGHRALAVLLILNNSSLQLLPSTIIALRSAYCAPDPAAIWLPTLLASAAATGVSVLLILLLPPPKGGGS